MTPNVSVPMNFGLKLLDSPTHNTLQLKASQGAVVRASSVILSFNSPVIDHMTTSLHLTSVDMEEFSEEAVRYFVDAAYSGQSPPISRNLFRDIHKLANVFQMSWLVTRCVQQFTDIAQSLQEPSYEDLLFLFDEAVYVLSQLKSRELVETALSKIRTLNEEENFIRNYLVDLNSLSTQQLDLIIELAGTSVEYIVEPLTEQLTASLERGEDKVPANCKYLLENSELHYCQIHHEKSHELLFDVLQKLTYQSLEFSRWVHQIFRRCTAKALKHSVIPAKLRTEASSLRIVGDRTVASASKSNVNSIPNLFHTLDCNMSFHEVVDWLGKSEEVKNWMMFFEGIWMWIYTRGVRPEFHFDPMLQSIIKIKRKRKWINSYSYYVINMWKHPSEYNSIYTIQQNLQLCNLSCHLKWTEVNATKSYDNITSIFKQETKLHFDISELHSYNVFVDKRNCYNRGKCGLLLKTVPAKDGANVVLCTDPAEYPDDMHFHKEFQAKDMHLSAYFTKPTFAFLPLSWHGTPVIKNNGVYWSEIVSQCAHIECNFLLFLKTWTKTTSISNI